MIVRVEPVMGTTASFHVLPGRPGSEAAEAVIEWACALLHRADDVFSTWEPGSPMSRLRAGECRLQDVPADIAQVLELCEQARELSEGWFDPWAMPGGVDPTGLVKGWAGSEALAVLAGSGVEAAMVNLGGDIAVYGEAPGGGPWRVGVRHPWRPDALACIVEVDHAIATSGRYERGDHLVDPFGRGTPTAASATVTGPDLALADAFATALAVAGDQGLAFLEGIAGYEGYLVRSDGTEDQTAGFQVVAAHVAGTP